VADTGKEDERVFLIIMAARLAVYIVFGIAWLVTRIFIMTALLVIVACKSISRAWHIRRAALWEQ
jgi:hypothetical protein